MPSNKIPTMTYFDEGERKLVSDAAAERGLSVANLLRVATGRFLKVKIQPLTVGPPLGNKNASRKPDA